MLLRIDHVGIACRSLEAAIDRYVSVFGFTVASEETNADQGVREAMLVTDSGDSYVQLLEPLGYETSTIEQQPCSEAIAKLSW